MTPTGHRGGAREHGAGAAQASPAPMRVRRMLLGAGIAGLIAVAAAAATAIMSSGSQSGYPWHPGTMASVFGPREDASASNAYISNAQSAWDKHWRRHAPFENRFFVALPYADYLDNGEFNPDNKRIPWHDANVWGHSEIKNRWVEITRTTGGRRLTAYGQVEDVGPSDKRTSTAVSDPDYVFGPPGHDPSDPIRVKPKNTFGLKAGIDLSRRLARALEIRGSGIVNWRFVDAADVPEGPWVKVVTSSPPNW
jgi:hypothetical protein